MCINNENDTQAPTASEGAYVMTGQFGIRFDRRDGVNMVELMDPKKWGQK